MRLRLHRRQIIVERKREGERGLSFVAVVEDGARRRNSPSWFAGDGAVVGEGRGKWRKRGGEICVRVLREERKTEMKKGEGRRRRIRLLSNPKWIGGEPVAINPSRGALKKYIFYYIYF
jgi:hypothetical protein